MTVEQSIPVARLLEHRGTALVIYSGHMPEERWEQLYRDRQAELAVIPLQVVALSPRGWQLVPVQRRNHIEQTGIASFARLYLDGTCIEQGWVNTNDEAWVQLESVSLCYGNYLEIEFHYTFLGMKVCEDMVHKGPEPMRKFGGPISTTSRPWYSPFWWGK